MEGSLCLEGTMTKEQPSLECSEGDAADISRRICCYFWALLGPEVPLIRALGTRRDDLCCRSSNPGSQGQQLLPCAPFPLPEPGQGTPSALCKWNRKIADVAARPECCFYPGWDRFYLLLAQTETFTWAHRLMFKHWFYGAGTSS